MSWTCQKWVLRKRPSGMVEEANFELVTHSIDPAQLKDDEVVVKNTTLSIDAFLRTMLDQEAYHGALDLGQLAPAIGVGVVVAAGKGAKQKPGSLVSGMLGAQTCGVHKSNTLMPCLRLPGVNPLAFLSLLSLTAGITAWVGMFAVLRRPRKKETVVITAATGAVGNIACQLAKNKGARVIGVAGGAAKNAFLMDELKLDGAVDYKAASISVGEQLDTLCPDGIDFCLDMVGGELLDEVLKRINPKGRIVVCGAASQYNGNLNVGTVRGPSEYLKLAEKGATMSGYNVMQRIAWLPWAMCSLLWSWCRGSIKVPLQVDLSIRGYPAAMRKMFMGGHVGKLLLHVDDESASKLKIRSAVESKDGNGITSIRGWL